MLNLTKGENHIIDKNTQTAIIGLGWDVNSNGGSDFDLDASVFMLGANGKLVGGDSGVIYFGHKTHASGAVTHSGDNLTCAGAGDDETIKVAIIGKPNVGKSSLINLILGEKRVIVSDVAGTTRDAVDTRFENKYGKYIFVDTAGIRRKSRVDDRVEKFSVMRAKLAIERADVCLIMIDAREGVTEQDTKIAGLAHEAGKASVVIVNKWDLVEKETGTMEKMRKDVMRDLSFMSYAPILFISALTGQRTERIFELINFVNDQSAMRITTGMLNNVLADAQARVQPPTDKGRRLKIYYMTQASVKPPTFIFFCNNAELFHFSYQRYLENRLREAFDFSGTPIRFVIRERSDK